MSLAKLNLEHNREQRAFAKEESDRGKERIQFQCTVDDNFSVQKCVSLVPRFSVSESEKFFESLENQARALRWLIEQHGLIQHYMAKRRNLQMV